MKRSKIGPVVILSIILNSVLALQPVGVNEAKAAFPGYNGKIIFNSNRVVGGVGSSVFIMDSNGGSQTNLTTGTGFNGFSQFSPDGTKVVFHYGGGGNQDIYIMDIDGGNRQQLTANAPYEEIYPTWSPDGTQIAYRRNQDGNFEIYVMGADGSNQTRLTTDLDRDDFPDWSPDGTQIIFTHGTHPNRQIYAMEVDGGNQVNLTQSSSDEAYADWSPDGSKIVFASKRDGNDEIYVMDANGSNQTRLTNNAFVDYYPSWSPDGASILFTSNRDGNFEIYSMLADGTNQTNLTNMTGSDDAAYWQPVPNTPPTLASHTLSTIANLSATKDVLGDTSDEEALDPANLTIKTQPSHGTASIESGKVKYTPSDGYVGTDQLTYQICDSFMLDQKCSTAVLSITVKPTAAIAKVGDRVVENGVEKVVAQSSKPTFSGTATPGSTVKVEIHSDPIILTTTAGSDGNWSVTPDQDLPPGDHTVTITATLNGITTELDSFVLAVQQTIPNTGASFWATRVGGGVLLISGLSLTYWQRKRMRELLRHQIPNLFP